MRQLFGDRQVLILLLAIVAVAVLLSLAADVLAPVLVAMVVAWLLEPFAAALTRRGLSRTMAAALLTVLSVVALAEALLFLAPVLLAQIAQLARLAPQFSRELESAILWLPELYPEFFDAAQVRGFAASLNADLVEFGQDILRSSVSLLPTLATIAIYLFILPLLVFFFIRDRGPILDWLGGFLPSYRPVADEAWAEISRKLGGYARGRAYEMAIVGSVSYVAFSLLGLEFSLLLAVLSGVSVLVPYFGAPVVAIPVALTALAQWGVGPELFWTIAVYVVIQAIDGAILATVLIAGAVNLHPIAVMMALLVFGDLYGFWGVVFAVPLASVVQVALEAWRMRAGARP